MVAISPANAVVGFLSGGPIREWAAIAVARGFRAAVVRVLASNPARHFYERLGARHVRDKQLTIGAAAYPGIWYGWDDLRRLSP